MVKKQNAMNKYSRSETFLCWAIKFLPGCAAKNNFSLGWLLNKWFRRLTMVFLLTSLGTDSELAEPRPPLTGNRLLVKLLLSFDFVLISRSSPLTSLFYEWGPDSQAWTSKTTVFCLTPRFSNEIFEDGIKRFFYPIRTTILFQKDQKAQT